MDLDASMRKSVEATQRTFNTIRTGRANASLLDKIQVEYYGAETPLKSLATITTPDSSTIQLQPFDGGSLGLIEKAISMSDLGLTCNNDGKVIRINIPPLTEDRRKDLCKLASKYAEEGKVALRNIRRDAIDKVKKQEKDGDYSEDQSRDEQEKIQKLTDRFSRRIRTYAESAGVEIQPDHNRIEEWRTTKDGGLLSSSVSGPITGYGANIIVIDDPIKGREDAESPTIREKTWEWITDDVYTRLEPSASLFMVAARWHEDDPIGALAELWERWKPQLDAYVTRALDPTKAPSYGVPGNK